MLKRCRKCDGLVEMGGDICPACREQELAEIVDEHDRHAAASEDGIYTHAIKYEGGGVAIYRSSHDGKEFAEIMAEYNQHTAGLEYDKPYFENWASDAGYDVEYVEVTWHSA